MAKWPGKITPKMEKVYKETQYKKGVEHFGKEHTISSMKEKYGSKAKSEALKKKKEGIESKGGINESGKYCRSCMSNEHKSSEHGALVKSGKISR